MEQVIDPNIIIDRIGGSGAVAKLCRITSGAVSQWRTNGIPQARLDFLRLARPDAFVPELADKQEVA